MATVMERPRVHRWTRDEYHAMGRIGLFDGKRVELLEGDVIEMSPIDGPHATAVTLVDDELRAAFGRGYVVRVQQPIALSIPSEPEPDALVVPGHARDYRDNHPTTATLLVEVASSSLTYDRTRKARAYARAGIADYWIVNLVDRQVEIHRDPQPDGSYASVSVAGEDDVVSPLAAPSAAIRVVDLLP